MYGWDEQTTEAPTQRNTVAAEVMKLPNKPAARMTECPAPKAWSTNSERKEQRGQRTPPAVLPADEVASAAIVIVVAPAALLVLPAAVARRPRDALACSMRRSVSWNSTIYEVTPGADMVAADLFTAPASCCDTMQHATLRSLRVCGVVSGAAHLHAPAQLLGRGAPLLQVALPSQPSSPHQRFQQHSLPTWPHRGAGGSGASVRGHDGRRQR